MCLSTTTVSLAASRVLSLCGVAAASGWVWLCVRSLGGLGFLALVGRLSLSSPVLVANKHTTLGLSSFYLDCHTCNYTENNYIHNYVDIMDTMFIHGAATAVWRTSPLARTRVRTRGGPTISRGAPSPQLCTRYGARPRRSPCARRQRWKDTCSHVAVPS